MKDETSIEDILSRMDESQNVKNKMFREQLIAYINHLLLHDFNKLVQLLYRVDINEQELKTLLQQNPEVNAAGLIADLLINRQAEKLKTKQSFPSNDSIPDEEKW